MAAAARAHDCRGWVDWRGEAGPRRVHDQRGWVEHLPAAAEQDREAAPGAPPARAPLYDQHRDLPVPDTCVLCAFAMALHARRDEAALLALFSTW